MEDAEELSKKDLYKACEKWLFRRGPWWLGRFCAWSWRLDVVR